VTIPFRTAAAPPGGFARIASTSLLLTALTVSPAAALADDMALDAPGSASAQAAPAAAAETPATGAPQTEAPATPETGDTPGDESLDVVDEYSVSILGRRNDRARIAGSAHIVDQKQLERMEYDDIQRVLTQVPGVNVRGEDGYGLRPNIGMRGANSDRSSKITLMEDGILFGPAPYSAPAAYYFPLATRMVGVEVFKGPSAIRSGPNTVGGAINLLTRKTPRQLMAYGDLAVGMRQYNKLHAGVGWGNENWGLLVEGARIATDGFKDLDGGGDTGFNRNDLMLKVEWNSDRRQGIQHAVAMKLGYGDEGSDESYLGLTAADYAATPYRRYAASRLDHMEWWRAQAQLSYLLDADWFDFKITAYRHDLSRAWFKLNRFRGGPPIDQALANPAAGLNPVYVAVLQGAEDTTAPGQTLLIGTNDRTYVSQGVQSVMHFRPARTGILTQEIEFGLRYHFDRISRDHTEDSFLMQQGKPVSDGQPRQTILVNEARTHAVAAHLQDEMRLGPVLLTPGARAEVIWSTLEDRQATTTNRLNYVAVMPGIGLNWQALEWLDVLAGVHRGFSPVSPGSATGVRPEYSWNYELGARANHTQRGGGQTRAELIGFFNDFQNITATCTASSGCVTEDAPAQFNGGSAWVYGLEALVGQDQPLGAGLTLRANLTYTLTGSQFRNSFTSANPQFGEVKIGDHLPYVPVHQGALTVGLSHDRFDFTVIGSAVGEQRDSSGQGEIPEAARIPGYYTLDAAISVNILKELSLYVKGDNLTNNVYMLSRRPYGIRPGLPLQASVGLKFNL